MALIQFSNHAGTTLNGNITAAATSLVVSSATGLPSAPFYIRVDWEIMRVDGVSGSTLTVVRGQDGTTAWPHTSGAPVAHEINFAALEKLRSDNLAIGTVEGRLSLVSATPVPSTDQSAKATLYYTPFTGKRISLYDGTYWRSYITDEISLGFSGSANAIYDVFAYYDSGTDTVKLEFSSAWSSDTARANALTRQDGVLVKSGTTTRRYLGTVRLSATNQCSDTKLQRFLYNQYNRVERSLLITDTGANYSYTSSTIREVRGTTHRAEVVIGQPEIMVHLEVLEMETATSGFGMPGIGVNSVTAFSNDFMTRQGTSIIPTNMALAIHYPAIGYNYYAWLEKNNSGTSVTYTTYTAGEYQTGLRGYLEI